NPEGIFPELIKYFVRGAECTLTKEVYGFPKGTRARYIDVAWEDPDDRVNFNRLTPGMIHNVKVPDYLVVEIIPKEDKKDKKDQKKKKKKKKKKQKTNEQKQQKKKIKKKQTKNKKKKKKKKKKTNNYCSQTSDC
ncbi:MAG: hypothetical protein GY697_13010, partial [Desulfobacterales bacterium]|nr:hypothetical protein [Desulfobacterales bacterium]